MAFSRPSVVNIVERIQAGADLGDDTLQPISWGTMTLDAAITTGGVDTQAFRFLDGTICVTNLAATRWSTNKGVSWTDTTAGKAAVGPMNGSNKCALEFGGASGQPAGGNILSMAAGATTQDVGATPHSLLPSCNRSTDYWATKSLVTVNCLGGAFNLPGAGTYKDIVNDAGGADAGPICHHKMLHLTTGGTISTWYGTRERETVGNPLSAPDGEDVYSSALKVGIGAVGDHRKYRMELFKSDIGDLGNNWNYLTELFTQGTGYLGRSTASVDADGLTRCRATVQEGFSEGCLVRRKSGDIWAFCRTGGTQSKSAHQSTNPHYSTSLMMRVLQANGMPLTQAAFGTETASTSGSYYLPIFLPTSPAFKCRWGNNPDAVTLGNGVTVLTAGGPGGIWFMVAQPSVRAPIFESFYKYSTSDAYSGVVAIGYNECLLFASSSGLVKCWRLQVDVTGEAGTPRHRIEAFPYHINAGQSSRLGWLSQNAGTPTLSGGAFGAGTGVSANSTASVTPAATTTYTLSDGAMTPVTVTVTVH